MQVPSAMSVQDYMLVGHWFHNILNECWSEILVLHINYRINYNKKQPENENHITMTQFHVWYQSGMMSNVKERLTTVQHI